jgi:hypothetical protein
MRREFLALTLVMVCTAAKADGPPLTLEVFQHLPADCPIIYDNDWLRDTVDDEYLFAQVHLGKARLVGLILTKDSWDNGKQYKVSDGQKDFEENLAILKQSLFKNLPSTTIGADHELLVPRSGRIEDTKPVASAGTNLIVAEARKASPEKPLVVIVGGPLITVASAYLTDPAIADRMIVLMTDISGYNGSDAWANFVVANRCKLLNFGASPLWWPQPPSLSVIPPDRFNDLFDSPVTREMKRVATVFYERSHRADHPDRCDGLADGAGTFLLFAPQLWHKTRMMRVTEAWKPFAVTGGAYQFLDAVEVDFDGMREEFFATMKAALHDAYQP